MIEKIEHGMLVYTQSVLSNGVVHMDLFGVSEMTGRIGLKELTVVPIHVWSDFKSPYFTSFQIPIEKLYAYNSPTLKD